jgi:hypothetical protein
MDDFRIIYYMYRVVSGTNDDDDETLKQKCSRHLLFPLIDFNTIN